MSYQQGIPTPTSLGVSPTEWKEPAVPTFKEFKPFSAKVGANREYGKTPDYVDTMPSRWNPRKREKKKGKKLENLGSGFQKLNTIRNAPSMSSTGSPHLTFNPDAGEENLFNFLRGDSETMTGGSGSRTQNRP